MSEQNVTIIGDTRIHATVSNAAKNRSVAVSIALELIKSSCAGQGYGALHHGMSRLSEHADTIQEALNK